MTRKLLAIYLILALCTAMIPAGVAAQTEENVFNLIPSASTLKVNDTFTVTLEGKSLTDLYAQEVTLTYDRNLLQYVDTKQIIEGFSVPPEVKENTIRLASTLTAPVTKGKTGDQLLYRLTFKAIGKGSTTVKLTSLAWLDSKDAFVKHGGTKGAAADLEIRSQDSPSPGGDSSSSPPSSISTPTPSPNPTSNPSATVVVVKALTDADGVASATVNAEELQKAIDTAKAQTIFIEVKSVDAAREVKVRIPLKQLQLAKDKQIIIIAVDTGLATVSINPNLLKNHVNETGGNLELSVVKVDPSASLPSKVRERLSGSQTVYDFRMSVNGKKLDKFDVNDVKVEIPYTLKPGENQNKVIICSITDDGKLEVIKNGKYNPATSKVTFKPKHFSQYAVTYGNVAFQDFAGAEWAVDAVEGLAAREAIDGVGMGNFNPSGDVTREEFIAILMRTFDLVDTEAEATFHDADPDAWYYSAVASAQKLGIVNGKEDGSFGIHDKISRQDMAVIIYRAAEMLNAGLTQSEPDAPFADQAQISGYALEAVTAVRQSGIASGMSGNIFAPKAPSTRAQAAAVIYRLYLGAR
ncbi:S-layer homology domain-containing protein [Paenibacillus sp. HWE-109]|uniref:S-layer homology domain-containing protein n=1 Tax=Paenibacillus sp. HWE-109 TaxID=1306526 RepID=UPI001EE105DF|nr:S-layer homology domain-containing protein [Paenibacillus sp. HWE-109]UKS28495.1 S-layer homology domain-containing protein [Paenibacillus sp. HWE-109]